MNIIACYVASRPETGDDLLDVRSPVDGRLIARAVQATEDQVERAVAAAAAVAPLAAGLPAHVRAAALDHVSRRLAERADEVARLITAENGKPIKWARVEVARAVSTFRWAAEETRRDSGELQRLDTDPGATGRMAIVRRAPRGPVLGISPFNFPLNLVAHKIAPAIAVGAPIVLKPAPATPLSALLLGELLAEVTEPDGVGTGLPAGMFSVLPIPNERAAALVADPRLPVVSFTGSGPVGAQIRSAVPDKHVTLELGGNAAAVVCGDWSSEADLDWAATRIATFGNYQAGQSCIAVQRVIVHDDLYDAFVPRLVDKVKALPNGDVEDETTEVGPVINDAAADRIEAWVRAGGGGRCAQRGRRLRARRARDRTSGPGRHTRRRAGVHRGGVRPGAGRVPGRIRRGRASPQSTTRNSACRRVCSRITFRRRSRRTARSTSAE